MVGTLAFVFPCSQPLLDKTICGGQACSKNIPIHCRFFVSFVDFIFMFPVTLFGGPFVSLCMISLEFLRGHLKPARPMDKKSEVTHDQSGVENEFRLNLAMVLRQAQLLGKLCNDCLQTYLWTQIQYNGAIAIVIPLYSLIVFGRQLSPVFIGLGLSIIIGTTMFCLYVFELGSRPQSISLGIIKRVLSQIIRPAMIGQFSLSIFRLQLTLADYLGAFPFHIGSKGVIKIRSEKESKLFGNFWLCLVITSLFYSVISLHESLSSNTTFRLTTVAYQAYLLEFHIVALLDLMGIRKNPVCVQRLIVYIYNSESFVRPKEKRQAAWFPVIFVSSAMTCVNLSLMVATLAFAFPCSHPLLDKTICGGKACSTNIPIHCRIFVSFFDFMCMFPVTLFGGPFMSLSLLSLEFLRGHLKLASPIDKKREKTHDQSGVQNQCQLNLAMVLRQAQILGKLCNDCLQTYIWTGIQFNGAVAIVIPLYSLIVFGRQLSPIFIGLGLSIIISTTTFCLYVFELGSRPQSISLGIIKGLRTCKRRSWSYKFSKSCKPITMKVGSFHKMDRKLGSSFVKFLVQRTVFLIVQTNAISK
ncbi:unnamed protein product [Orchesella dallaii]|uniref:Uncharacterized protein n=1 Tax=Orchesella dallaii TaxID=48710 RepID=A0ABP1S7S4_9HEXA